jgi:hypothetical protein
MGEGLKRVAKQCGGIKSVERDGTVHHFDADGNLVVTLKSKPKEARPMRKTGRPE